MYLTNKYTKYYNSIISRALSRTSNSNTYHEVHHIIPKSLNGTNLPENLVNLTAREHFICHLLLTKMVTGSAQHKMMYALWCMSMLTERQQQYKIKSRTYSQLREAFVTMKQAITPWNKGIIGCYTQSAESNAKRSASLKGKTSPNKGKTGAETSFFNKSHTDKTKQIIASKNAGKVPWNKGLKGAQVAWNKGLKKDTTSILSS